MARKLGSSDDNNVVALNPSADARRELSSQVTSSTFLDAVREIAKVNAEASALNERRKGIRKKWKAEGIELGLLDAALKMAEWDRSEVRSHFDTSRRYAEWLGLPIGQQADLFKTLTDDKVQKAEWFGLGRVSSRLGKPGRPPEECPEEYHQAFMAGFNEEDEAEWLEAEIADAQTQAAAAIDPNKSGNVADIAQALAAKPPKTSRRKPPLEGQSFSDPKKPGVVMGDLNGVDDDQDGALPGETPQGDDEAKVLN